MATSDSESSKGAFDREDSNEILHRQFGESRVAHGVNPLDGLPSPIAERCDLEGPPLTHDHFVCIADERAFVLRDGWGEVILSFDPEMVTLSPNGRAWVELGALRRQLRTSMEEKGEGRNYPQTLNEIGRRAFGAAGGDQLMNGQFDSRVEVQPLRARCKFLVEMVNGFERSSEHVQVIRLCQMRHDADGDLLSLGDEMVVACTARSPSDFVSTDRLRRLNKKTIADGEKRVAAGGIFDVNAIGAPDALEGILE